MFMYVNEDMVERNELILDVVSLRIKEGNATDYWFGSENMLLSGILIIHAIPMHAIDFVMMISCQHGR
jgi:hypothetical protein